MITKTIFKVLAMAMLMPAMLLTTACSSSDDDDAVINHGKPPRKAMPFPSPSCYLPATKTMGS